MRLLVNLVSDDPVDPIDPDDPDGIKSCEDDPVGEMFKCKFNLGNERNFALECFRYRIFIDN